MAAKKVLTIEVISDTVCPFCFVGKRKFEKALAEVLGRHPEVAAEVHWKPFFLNRNLPVSPGLDKMQHYQEKFGRANVERMFPNMKRIGQQVGINFSFGGRISNTMNSHRLVEFSKAYGVEMENRCVEALFKRYFEQEKDIGDLDVLLSAAQEAGLPVDAAKEYLQSDHDVEKILKEAEDLPRKVGVQGVPHFLIKTPTGDSNNSLQIRASISGAQESGHFAAYMEEILEELDS